jgi:hypothetical protein
MCVVLFFFFFLTFVLMQSASLAAASAAAAAAAVASSAAPNAVDESSSSSSSFVMPSRASQRGLTVHQPLQEPERQQQQHQQQQHQQQQHQHQQQDEDLHQHHFGEPSSPPPPPVMAGSLAVPSKFKPVEVIEEGKRKPYLYETAYEVLKEDGTSMYYKEVAARINAMGIPTTGDQVLGALGGWYAHAGSEYLERTGPGRFRARPGKVFVPSTGTREINAVMIVKPPLQPSVTNANGDPEPMVQIGQAFFSRTFLHQMNVSKAPFYQLACEILREALVPMHYREIASVLKASGRNVHQDTIMGSLNGFINTPVGKSQLQRVGKGIYTLCDFVRADQRTASIMPPPPLQRAPPSVASPLPPSVVMLPGSGTKRGREFDDEEQVEDEDNVVAELSRMHEEAEDIGEEEPMDEEFEKAGDEAGDEELGIMDMSGDEEGLPLLEDDEMLAEEGEQGPPSKRALKEGGENEIPTFLEVYYLFKERAIAANNSAGGIVTTAAAQLPGLTLPELVAALEARGCPITTTRLNSRLSAYTSYRRKKVFFFFFFIRFICCSYLFVLKGIASAV